MSTKENYSENLVDLLMATFGSSRSTHLFRSILREQRLKRYKKDSIRMSLYRLRSKGYLKNYEFTWSITSEGKKYFNSTFLLGYIPSPFEKNAPANIVIAFDIPEKNRKVRNWLRNQIKIFGYKMLQQSLWIGPGPLPSSFLKRLEDLKIRKNVKTFKISNKKGQ